MVLRQAARRCTEGDRREPFVQLRNLRNAFEKDSLPAIISSAPLNRVLPEIFIEIFKSGYHGEHDVKDDAGGQQGDGLLRVAGQGKQKNADAHAEIEHFDGGVFYPEIIADACAQGREKQHQVKEKPYPPSFYGEPDVQAIVGKIGQPTFRRKALAPIPRAAEARTKRVRLDVRPDLFLVLHSHLDCIVAIPAKGRLDAPDDSVIR